MQRRSWLDVFADYRKPEGLGIDEVRRNISIVDQRLQELWHLGENLFIAWASTGGRTLLLALPHYRLAEHVSGARPIEGEPRPEAFIGALISGSRRLAENQLHAVAAKLGIEPRQVDLPFAPDGAVGDELMSALIQRYGLAYTKDRPVILVDIVGFSLFPPVEQVVLLQSLSHSLNSAYAKLASRDIPVNFARSTTGDGFYIWNRTHTLEGGADLYRLMLLMLADNAIAQRKSRSGIVPKLRTAFHVGPHYEFYQSEGLSPTLASYLVGEVTISLARLVAGAMPGQLLLGEFQTLQLGTVEFVERMRKAVWNLSGIPVAGEAVREIKCYLTGPRHSDGTYRINRYVVSDKHGIRHPVFNAKINIHREAGESIFLGIRDQEIHGLEAAES